MRRLVSLAALLFFAIPFGTTLAGCSKGVATQFCNGGDSGVVVGQTTTLDLEPRLTGVSLNQGQIGTINAPSAKDCKGNTSSVTNVRYGVSDMSIIDIEPTNGRLCAGTWNRNTGGGIADFTTCTANGTSGVALVTASASGVTSNALPVYSHPIVTSIALGAQSSNCSADPASNCYDSIINGQCAAAVPAGYNSVFNYTGNSCISQNGTAQLAARTFNGTTNISCQVGPLTFAANNPAVVTIDQNGLATAVQPGSTIINANISQNASSAGFFATCPPRTIVLTTQGSTTPPTAPVSINQNTTQSLVATVTDTNNNPITAIDLTYVSTSPTTIPASGSAITPVFPGSASITAICQPPTCNTSPFNEIGLFNNGTPVLSNPVQISATGTANSTVLYIGSTNSQYIQPVDFTVPTQGTPLRLPYVPNSMALSEDLTTLYLGSTTELMIVSVTNTGISLTKEDTSATGTVLSIAPNNATIVIADAQRGMTYLYNSGGGFATQYGGVGTRAQWSPDSSTVYITTTTGQLLVHSTFTGWTAVPLPNVATDVALTVPNAGVYLGNNPNAGTVMSRTNCPVTAFVNPTAPFPTTTNVFYPPAPDNNGITASASRLAATNDGLHILGASLTNFTDLTTNAKQGACPVPFTSAISAAPAFTGLTASNIVDVLPTSDSQYAFAIYTGKGNVVPQYVPSTKTLTNVALQTTASGTPSSPLRGVVSSDNQTLYLGTAGDNVVHRLTRGAAGFADTLAPVVPNLPAATGTGLAQPDLIVQKPRKSNS